ncbi:pyridoxal phosphate-dependent decarboxylase family protein [Ruania halotolerans]|uniref:pyridoxal phosphate-dependent decarboxylase family protein n=1 Tax=Ruania halotolerans TaxID=2897773 RepID=UPI001E3FAA46|nr:aspartate aminotransferase family protein [Ruania halotolerans]UFU04732.1 aspartate aminotransferase family protein [Ruania halotolerans]
MIEPQSPASVLDALTQVRAADPPTHGGRVLSYVYDHGRPELDELAARAATMFLPVNGLDPTTFASVAVLERDLVAFTREVLHGDESVVGSVTSGGTESCLLAVKSARERWLAAHSDSTTAPHAETPRLVLPTTAHPAFRKAAHYLGLARTEVPVDPHTGAVDAQAMLAAVDDSTALVVLSAPNYPFGTMDPIAQVAPALAARDVPLHVDACIGGWLLPWWPGHEDEWDFAVPGVTSMSTDLHKYGYAPKGASVVLYRGRERHRAQYYATTEWPGYPVVNPTMLGSRSATSLAASWAVTRALGTTGYAELVQQTAHATSAVRKALSGISGLTVVGRPAAALLAVAADPARAPAHQVDPFALVDAVRRHGFLLQAQPAFTQPDHTALPRTAHLTLTPVTDRVTRDLVAALRAGADEVRGLSPRAPDPDLVAQVATEGLPEEMAPVLATLEAMDPGDAAAALTGLLASVIDPDVALGTPGRDGTSMHSGER